LASTPQESAVIKQLSWHQDWSQLMVWFNQFNVGGQALGAGALNGVAGVSTTQSGKAVGFQAAGDWGQRALKTLWDPGNRGTGLWAIVQFSMPNVVSSGTIFEFGNNTWGTGAFGMSRNATNNGIGVYNHSGTLLTSTTPCNTALDAPNTLLFVDRGSGVTQYSLNGGALVNANNSNGMTYQPVNTVIGGVLARNVNSRNWGAGNAISMVTYWVGSPGNMPSTASLLTAAQALHAGIS
jgi:hypothetical protein